MTFPLMINYIDILNFVHIILGCLKMEDLPEPRIPLNSPPDKYHQIRPTDMGPVEGIFSR